MLVVLQAGTHRLTTTAAAVAIAGRAPEAADIEIERLPTGQPAVRLHGRAQVRAEQLGMGRIAVTISHEADYAVAMAFGLRTTGGRYLFPPDIEDRLDDRERLIITSRFGLGGHAERTLEQLGRELGITKERVRQIESRGVDKLRKIAGEQKLELPML